MKILGLLIGLNVALWLFFLIFDDFIPYQIYTIKNDLKLSAALYTHIAKPIITDSKLSEFEKNVNLGSILTKELLSDTSQVKIYRYQGDGNLRTWYKYYDSVVSRPNSEIKVIELPPLSLDHPKKRMVTIDTIMSGMASRIFQFYKPILKHQITTVPIVEIRARFTPQEEVLSGEFDVYEIRRLLPVRNNSATVGIIEIIEKYSIKDAYIGRNQNRLKLLGGISVITLLLGLALSFSIAIPLRRLSKRLNKNLTPNDISLQLQGLSISSLRNRKDEIGQLHKNLIKLTSQVAHLFKDKERFASEVSHELKNPIASIVAYAENFENQEVKDLVIVNKIKSQAMRMSKLVTEISEAAIVDHDLVTQRREKFNFVDVVQGIIDHYVDSNEYRKVIITSDIPTKTMITGLPDRLGQVLVNLMDNALSFTQPSGEVKITLSKRWRKPVILTVEDSGPGVDPEFRTAIFERFFTSREGSAAVKNASGLGLHICQQIVEAHSGTIRVDTSKLGGAKFVVTIK